MVHFFIFNPTRKIRLLTTLLYRGSKRILASANSTSALPPRKPRKAVSLPLFKFDLLAFKSPSMFKSDSNELIQDTSYYKPSESGSCVFQVENTLFKVHRILLIREPSAFGDMFSLAQERDIHDVPCSGIPVKLSDTVAQFRDLLWALYSPPSDVYNETQIDRLLNIAELTNKYSFSSFETWVVDRIYALAQEPVGPLHSASPEVYARMLNVSILCNHTELRELVIQHLISRILWYNMPPELVLAVAELHGLRILQGVCYYRQLINMEQVSCDDGTVIQPHFPSTMDNEKHTRFLSAHHSLLKLWEQLCTSPPVIHADGCRSHAECTAALKHLWFEVGTVNESLRRGSADVLGRLKIMMISLRRSMANTPSITLQCKMAVLEAITDIRDETIGGLIGHFTDLEGL